MGHRPTHLEGDFHLYDATARHDTRNALSGVHGVLLLLLGTSLLLSPSFAAGSGAQAAEADAPPQVVDPPPDEDEADQKREAERYANREFLGIRFGIGFGMTMDPGPPDRVDDAALVNGIVRVGKQANHRPRVLFETHYFWRLVSEATTVGFRGEDVSVQAADIGIGPFAAIQGSDEELLESFAIGGMVGFKRDERSSFNIGFGVALDPTVKVLGDGIRPNEPLPAGEETLRFKEEPRWSYLVLVSFSF